MTDAPSDGYLICKHGLYYAPNSQGYTGIRDKAGRYTLAEAIDCVHPNGKDGPRDGMDCIHESEAPEFSPKCFEDLKVKHLSEARDKLAADLADALEREAALREAPFPDETGFFGLIGDAMREAEKAMQKFPQPNYVISKVAEEAGEVVKAAIHCAEGRETAENVRGEMKQLIAMLYRLWVEGDQVHGLPPVRPGVTP